MHVLVVLLLALPTMVAAQSRAPSIADHDNWSVFLVENPKQCFVASQVAEMKITREGQRTTARRGDPVLHVTHTPGDDSPDVISAFLGFPPDPNRKVVMTIGSDTFEMLAGDDRDGEWAWVRPENDQAALDALKGGAKAVVTSTSRTGKLIEDSFSLIGFSKALGDALTRCAN